MNAVVRWVEGVLGGWARVGWARVTGYGPGGAGAQPRELFPFVEVTCPHGIAYDVACDLIRALGVDLHQQPAEGPAVELSWMGGQAEATIILWCVDDAELADPGARGRDARERARADAERIAELL